MKCTCPDCATWRQLYFEHPLDRRRTITISILFLLGLSIFFWGIAELAPSLEEILSRQPPTHISLPSHP